MGKYLLGRFIATLPVLFGVSLFTFMLVRLVPGDPIQIMLGPDVLGNAREEITRLYGLDRPWPVQYAEWLGNVVRGDLGMSLRTGMPITESIWQRLPATLELTLLAIIIGLVIGMPLAIFAAQNRGRLVDGLVSAFVLIGISMPGFWLATLLVLLFSLYLGWLPPIGYISPLENPAENLRRMILPAISLGVAFGATTMRFTRSSLLEVFNQEYVRTARAKGLNERLVVYRHALKNALIPVVTVTGIQIGRLLGGTVIIEQIFALPGIGRYVFDAISMRDYPVIQGTVMFFTIVFVVINLTVDLLYGVIDPRIKFAGSD
ncbi:MAG: ABC transporter permease [Anaerolineales bacterium]|nr:ABC transporter permease [Anaerolineales bacterium]